MKPTPSTDVLISPDSLRSVREAEARPPRVAVAPRTSAASAELEVAVEELKTARTNAIAQFEIAATQIASALESYHEAWKHAVACSKALDPGPAPGMPFVGGPLQPATSELHPKKLKAALARVLAAADISIFDMPTRVGGGRRRGRR